MDSSTYQSEEDVLFAFKKLSEIEIDELNQSEETQRLLRESVKIQNSVQELSLFSKNEELEDIKEEHLGLLRLPFIMAQLFSRLQDNRLKQLDMANQYYKVYMQMLLHHQLVTSSIQRQWKQLQQETDEQPYQVTREDKVDNYKQHTSLKQQLKGQLSTLQTHTLTLQSTQYDVMQQVLFIREEKKMLHFRQQLNSDPEKKEAYDNRNKNIPQIQSITIPKTSQPPLINSHALNQAAQPVCGQCMKFGNQDIIGLTNQQIRQELKERVFQPGHSVPTMRLDDFADQEIAYMEQAQAAQEKAKAEAERNKVDSDQEEYDEKKTLEKRAWDDWKDDNEKGGGNKQR